MLPRFRVSVPVDGGWRIPYDGASLEIGTVAHLERKKGDWEFSVDLEAPNETEAIRKGRIIAKTALSVFQCMLDYDVCKLMLTTSEQRGTLASLDSGKTILGWAKESEEAASRSLSNPPSREEFQVFQNFVKGIKERNMAVSSELLDENGSPISAVYYFGLALEEPNPSFRFLNCMTVLEALVSEALETTEKVARRVAVLVGAQPNYLRYNMQEIYDLMKEFYGKRSRILHGSDVPNITSAESNELLRITQVALRNYLFLASIMGTALRRNKKRDAILERLDRFLDQKELEQLQRDVARFS